MRIPSFAASHDILECRRCNYNTCAFSIFVRTDSTGLFRLCVFSFFVRRNSAPFHQPDLPNSHCGDATQGPMGG